MKRLTWERFERKEGNWNISQCYVCTLNCLWQRRETSSITRDWIHFLVNSDNGACLVRVSQLSRLDDVPFLHSINDTKAVSKTIQIKWIRDATDFLLLFDFLPFNQEGIERPFSQNNYSSFTADLSASWIIRFPLLWSLVVGAFTIEGSNRAQSKGLRKWDWEEIVEHHFSLP